MARRRKREEIEMELDSFLDILTNAIGIIIVITVMAILNSSQMTYIFRTPFARKTEKKPLFFECRNERVLFINKNKMHEKLEEYRFKIEEQQLTDIEIKEKIQSKYYTIEDDHYYADLNKFVFNDLEVFLPKEGKHGETVGQLSAELSEFKSLAQNIDPDKNFVFFLVRPDSYDVFRKARKILWKLDIQAGWEPLVPGRQIMFGSKGRSAVVD